MFIRIKKHGNQVYYYLVKAYRENGKPKQKVVKYLGKSKPSPKELNRIIGELK